MRRRQTGVCILGLLANLFLFAGGFSLRKRRQMRMSSIGRDRRLAQAFEIRSTEWS